MSSVSCMCLTHGLQMTAHRRTGMTYPFLYTECMPAKTRIWYLLEATRLAQKLKLVEVQQPSSAPSINQLNPPRTRGVGHSLTRQSVALYL